jgi:hypothetical protein
MRVVWIDASPSPLWPHKVLTAGKIYLIRAIARGNWKPRPPGYGLHLNGITIFYPRTNGTVFWAFHPGRFAPVI